MNKQVDMDGGSPRSNPTRQTAIHHSCILGFHQLFRIGRNGYPLNAGKIVTPMRGSPSPHRSHKYCTTYQNPAHAKSDNAETLDVIIKQIHSFLACN